MAASIFLDEPNRNIYASASPSRPVLRLQSHFSTCDWSIGNTVDNDAGDPIYVLHRWFCRNSSIAKLERTWASRASVEHGGNWYSLGIQSRSKIMDTFLIFSVKILLESRALHPLFVLSGTTTFPIMKRQVQKFAISASSNHITSSLMKQFIPWCIFAPPSVIPIHWHKQWEGMRQNGCQCMPINYIK